MQKYFFVAGAFAVFALMSAAEEIKAPKDPKMPLLKGLVLSVDIDAKTVTISEEILQTTLFLNEKSTLTFKGPILDGIKAGDRVEAQVSTDEKGQKLVIKMTITRDGVSPGMGPTSNKEKNKAKPTKKDVSEAPPISAPPAPPQ